MDAFLNELSLPTLQNSQQVIQMFNDLGLCYSRARIYGIRQIKILSSFYNHEFVKGYTFLNWVIDNNADLDLRTLLKSVMGTAPFIDQIISEYQTRTNSALQIFYNQQECYGLGLASNYIYNSIAFSYNVDTWNQSQYTVSISILNEDDAGNYAIEKYDATALNISNLAHSNRHQNYINSRIAITIQDGRDLLNRRLELFPNLRFCSAAENQLLGIGVNTISFQQIILRLFDLQNVSLGFNGNPIKPSDFPTKTTPESNSREQQYRNELTILCPDGVYRFFTWHSRFTPNGRIHFYPFETEGRILIGYVGNKLI